MGDETDDRHSVVADPSPASNVGPSTAGATPVGPTTSGPTGSEALAREFEDAIRVGTLGPGDRLPTVRALARDRAVAPGTVAAAYRTLAHRGVIVGRGRAGTFVSSRTVAPALQVDTLPAGLVDLRSGNPDPALLPAVPIGPLARTTYGEAPLDARFEAGARHWLAGQGVPDGPLVAVCGAMDGVERVLAAHLRPGDAIAVEDPGYPGVVHVARALGLGVVPVRIDGAGMVPEELAAILGSVQAVVLTPRAQNPTGAALTARATRLTATLSAAPDVLVVHDDHSGDVSGVPLQLVGPSDGSGRPWALVHSFAKTFGPDWRIAVVTGDDVTVDRVDQRFRVGPGWVSHRLQRAIGRALTDPARRAEIERATASYARRRRALVTALDDVGVAPWPTADLAGASGWNVWVAVPEESEVVVGMAARGWAVLGGARFRHRSGPGIRCSVAALAPERAADAARALADVLAGSGPRPV